MLWNKTKCELVGAYRAGNTQRSSPNTASAGLYTSTLFRYDERLLRRLGRLWNWGVHCAAGISAAIRSTMLLWKGIARLVATHPEAPVLFGAVSISNDYNETSREMIYSFSNRHIRDDELAG